MSDWKIEHIILHRSLNFNAFIHIFVSHFRSTG